MNYYKLRITGENKVWKKYFTYAERFLRNNGKEVTFTTVYYEGNLDNLKIQALSENGDVVKEELFFIKEKMPEFSVIERVMLIKEDVIDISAYANLKGVDFYSIKVDGTFSKEYKLLNFTTAVNCIDEVNSKRADIEFFSRLVLNSTKIPNNVDGFFLDGWNKYGKFTCIVTDKLKDKLLNLNKAKDFLIFDKIQIS